MLPPTTSASGLVRDRDVTLYAGLCTGTAGEQGIWRIRPGRPPVRFAALPPNAFLGANGIKVHDGAVWVGNTDRGTLVRLPIRSDGSAGPAQVRARGLAGVDDFAFTGRGDTLLAALNDTSQVALVLPDGRHRIVLQPTDGLADPSSVAVCGDRILVPSAAYRTGANASLLAARLRLSGR